jgi:hypothetical protein
VVVPVLYSTAGDGVVVPVLYSTADDGVVVPVRLIRRWVESKEGRAFVNLVCVSH